MMENLPSISHRIIGHRGVAGLAPENTLTGFQLASQLGLNWVEFDTQLCSTGEWIVFHDETFERICGSHASDLSNPSNLAVYQTSYDQLKSLDAGAWFNSAFKNEPIPLLLDTLAYLDSLDLHPNIEIKWFLPKTVNKKLPLQDFIALLRKTWPTTKAWPLVSSFDWEILTILRTLMPELPLGLLTEDFDQSYLAKILEHKINTLHCQHQYITQKKMLDAKTYQIPILAYTVNSITQIQSLQKMGVTGIFSDLTFLQDINLGDHCNVIQQIF